MTRSILRAAAVVAAAAAVFVAIGPASAATPDSKLLAKFQPMTHFDPAETFAPTSVQSFIADSTLERYDGTTWVVADPQPQPGTLPQTGTYWRLNQQPCTTAAALGGRDCYVKSWLQGGGAPVVYGRVAHQSGETILQYWYFYYDDVYSYLYPPANDLWQAHEGDWEVVNVVLDGNEQALSVGYSQHCLGQTRPWADTPKWGGTHPVVYVAAGSHANYFDVGTHQFNVACVPKAVQAALYFLGLPLPADRTGDGAVTGPPRTAGGSVTHILQIGSSSHAWVGFAGYWGEGEYFYAATLTPAPVLAGTSPTGPAYHAVWTDPLGTLALWPTG